MTEVLHYWDECGKEKFYLIDMIQMYTYVCDGACQHVVLAVIPYSFIPPLATE